MTTETKQHRRRRGARGEPDLMTKSQLAHAMGEVKTETIDEWVGNGTVPPPHSQPGERTALWLRSHYLEFLRTGRWPKEAWRTEEAKVNGANG